jgi:Rrf2 family protein
MQLSKRAEYGLRALLDLALAHRAGRGHVRAGEIRSLEGIPAAFLEQILARLRSDGFLTAKRGRDGGYSLARPAETISMGEALRSLENSLGPLRCVEDSADASCTCPDRENCGLRLLMVDVHAAMVEVMDRYSLADIAEIALNRCRRENLPVPFSGIVSFSESIVAHAQ